MGNLLTEQYNEQKISKSIIKLYHCRYLCSKTRICSNITYGLRIKPIELNSLIKFYNCVKNIYVPIYKKYLTFQMFIIYMSAVHDLTITYFCLTGNDNLHNLYITLSEIFFFKLFIQMYTG